VGPIEKGFPLRIVLLLLLLAGCRELGLTEGTLRERYQSGLVRSGLDSTVLGRQWLEAGRAALAGPVAVVLPFRETGFFPSERILAAGFSFSVERGQRITVHLSAASSEPGHLFLELFDVSRAGTAPDLLASTDSGETALDLEADASGRYMVRIQPELLLGVRYTITIRAGPSMGFPVEGAGNDAVRSRYGASRDGGRRRHEGIDIFAPRGTPVLAATHGRVVNVGDNRLGGLVVWLHDAERNQNLYYAHLDRQRAREGDNVAPGDTLGFVGNTGNARTTPPHLHFGIYRRGEGAIDPFPFVGRVESEPPSLSGDSTRLGRWLRVSVPRAPLSDGTMPDTLPRSTVMRALGISGSRYRVELADGRTGYVSFRSVETAGVPLSGLVLESGGEVVERPVPGAVTMERLAPGARVTVLGEMGEYQMVALRGSVGWLRRS
jgi:murein DD-endopeptidase MepM/ murein hydrolase activator NlpD